MQVIIRNQAQVLSALKRIDKALVAERPALFQTLGRILRDDVVRRMDSRDGGAWKPPSKWIMAKKNVNQVLAGQSRRVNFQSLQDKLVIFFASPGQWTLTQHHDGFTVPPTGDRVTIQLSNPSALALPSSAKAFSFISRRPSVVPARKAWPSEAEALAKVNPAVSIWLTKTLRGVPGVRV